MQVVRYSVEIENQDWDFVHFELREDDRSRPFHVALRRTSNMVALNSMIDGEWGPEEARVLPYPIDELKSIKIEVEGDMVIILLNGELQSYRMPISQDNATLKVAGRGVKWARSLAPANLARPGDEDSNLVKRFFIAGRILQLDVPHNTTLERHLLVEPSFETETPYVNFLATSPLIVPGSELTVIDTSPHLIFNALTAAVLLPQAKVLIRNGDSERDALIRRLVQQNGIANLEIVGVKTLSEKLKSVTGYVLLQGPELFSTLGSEIEGLSPERRNRLSIFTDADTPVPGNRVFPCFSAHIQADPKWRLNYSPATQAKPRRNGLDIAVASYNSGDYLIECVTSLLCEGRDDIRVIIVDDGSTDDSGYKAGKHFSQDPRVRVERKPNGGCASARNFGRLISDATHIAFVDADDFVTPNFFTDIYDLALYSGCEVAQGGFDFYDEDRVAPYYASYEEDIFAGVERNDFGGQPVIRLYSADIIKGQPTIWRKVYRRDFLDAKNIFFPENIRAYDDYIFQMLTLTAARDILMMPEHLYHYRQHSAQDIKKGDERHFYMLQMFRTLLRRSVDEGWENFVPYLRSITDCIEWSSQKLRADLVDSFLKASAQFCVSALKVYGGGVLTPELLSQISHPDFNFHYQRELSAVSHIPEGVHWALIHGSLEHPDVLRMRNLLPAAN